MELGSLHFKFSDSSQDTVITWSLTVRASSNSWRSMTAMLEATSLMAFVFSREGLH